MSTYVTLRPRSSTNHSDQYRVVTMEAWQAARGSRLCVAVTGGELFDTAGGADARRDELNIHPCTCHPDQPVACTWETRGGAQVSVCTRCGGDR